MHEYMYVTMYIKIDANGKFFMLIVIDLVIKLYFYFGHQS